MDSNGKVWIIDDSTNRLRCYDPATNSWPYELGSVGSEIGQFVDTKSIAFDGEGILWMADRSNYRLQRYDPHSHQWLAPIQTPTQFKPNFIASHAGFIWVTGIESADYFRRLNPKTGEWTTFGLPSAASEERESIKNPVGISFQVGSPHLFVIDDSYIPLRRTYDENRELTFEKWAAQIGRSRGLHHYEGPGAGVSLWVGTASATPIQKLPRDPSPQLSVAGQVWEAIDVTLNSVGQEVLAAVNHHLNFPVAMEREETQEEKLSEKLRIAPEEIELLEELLLAAAAFPTLVSFGEPLFTTFLQEMIRSSFFFLPTREMDGRQLLSLAARLLLALSRLPPTNPSGGRPLIQALVKSSA
jgi:hypothetical protein